MTVERSQSSVPSPDVPPTAGASPVVGVGVRSLTDQSLRELVSLLPPPLLEQMVLLVRTIEPLPLEEVPQRLGGVAVFDPRRRGGSDPASAPSEPPQRPIWLPHNQLVVLPQTWSLAPHAEGWHLGGVASESESEPIDGLLHELAMAAGPQAIGIVLESCHGSGGSGMRALAEAGGMLLLENGRQQRVSGNPKTELPVDFRGGLRQLASELRNYIEHLNLIRLREPDQTLRRNIEEALPEIVTRLRERTDHNFKHYKTSTLVRRVRRRMQVVRDASVEDYLDRLRGDPPEVTNLFSELLIGVTQFFRDPPVFESLAKNVIPCLFDAPQQSVRVWVPGCSTGQEAYSIAMLLMEAADQRGSEGELQVFASDIDEESLQVARRGIYSRSIESQVTPERLERFFARTGDEYRVKKELRDLCLFSCHSIISDPPFSRVDLISCRNLLIYMGPHLQQKLISVFHYALRERGFLVVGTAESLNAHGDLFQPFDPPHRIARRRATGVSTPIYDSENARTRTSGASLSTATPHSVADLGPIAQRILLDEFAPVMAVINESGEIRYTSGDFGRYVSMPTGTFHNDIVRLARPGLRVGLRASIRDAIGQRRRVTHEDLSVVIDDRTQRLTLIVQPMPNLGDEANLYMVVLKELGPPVDRREAARTGDHGTAERMVEQLERELQTTRADLERTVRDLEAANEELKSSNEELLSMNEELQSTNEELESSKEEIETAKDAIQSANSDLQNLLRSTRIAVLFLSDDLRIRSFTPAVSQIYNILPADVGRPLSHVTHRAAEMPPLCPVTVTAVADSADEDASRLRIRTDEGRWFLRQVLPYQTDDGAQDGIVVVFTDVTELQRIEQSRQAVEMRTEVAFDVGRFGYWHWEIGSQKMVCSRVLREIFGLPLVGEPHLDDFWACIHPDDLGSLRETIGQVLETGQPYTHEFRIVKPNGDVRWIAARGATTTTGEEALQLLIGVNWDITERKDVEEELRVARWHAEAASRSKSEFLANMSHEIRTPMTAILGYADLLSEQLDDPTSLEQVETIRRNGRFLLNIINDILDLSKIDAGRFQMHRQRCAIGPLILEVCEQMEVRVRDKGLRMNVEFEGQLPDSIDTDATRLRQILVNLIGNAIKFTDEGQISVRTQLDPTSAQLRIDVLDTGIGIDEQIQSHLFAPFTQVDTSNRRHFSGTGLGLAITRRLVTMLGGEVSLASQLGQGSRFTVTLPTGSLEGVALGAPPVLEAGSPKPDGGRSPIPLKILVVDDGRDIRMLASVLLGRLGAEVAVADGGATGVAALNEHRALGHPFDVVIMDVQMPGMDGPAAVRQLRQQGHELPVIALTANAMQGDRQRCLDAGYTDYLSKPLDIAILNEMLAKYVKV